jgi:hypothetical protein
LEFGTNGSVNFLFDSSVKDLDSKDEILIGILNESGHYITSTGYGGPNNVFSSVDLSTGLYNGKSTYFEIHDPFEDDKGKDDGDDDDDDDDHKSVTPEPSSLLLLGTSTVVLGGIIRRKLGKLPRDHGTKSGGVRMSLTIPLQRKGVQLIEPQGTRI